MIIKKMTKITLNEVLIVSVTIIVLLFINNLIFEQPILFRQLENKMVDLRFKLRGTKDSKSDVIIVGVDEKV